MNFKQYFTTLQDWSRLPGYRLEERIGPIIGFFLRDIMKDALETEIQGVIPEFPLRLGTIHPEFNGKPMAERSYKVDFYAPGEDGTHYFVEVKTAATAGLEQQDDYLDKAMERGMEKIVDGLTRIAKLSSHRSRDKYEHLKGKLKKYGILNKIESYIHPGDEVRVIYIQPRIPRKEKRARIIDFKTVAAILKQRYPEDAFTTAFAETLAVWAED